MSVVEIAVGVIRLQFTDLVERVEADFKAEVGKHNRTGEAQASIRVLEQDDQHALIGGYNSHLYWLDQGNARSGNRLYPTHAKALGKYPDGIPGIGWRGAVNAYQGFHIAKKVADKYR